MACGHAGFLISQVSVVLAAQLKIGMRMGADRAYGGSAGANVDVAAIAADPDLLARCV